MAKDPAFLFYPGDWLGGTLGMTFEQKGAYMELLMMQFTRGHMTEDMIGQVVGQNWDKLQDKFKRDANGLFYNERLDIEKEKRKKYVDSRKNNVLGENQYSKETKEKDGLNGHTTKHMSYHMENENENENKDISVLDIKDRAEKFSESVMTIGAKTYTSKMLTNFIEHWTEPNRAKKPKMKFELQKTWDTGKRLATWAKNNFDKIECFLHSDKPIKDKQAELALKMKDFTERYSKDELNSFYRYWSQPENIKNPTRIRWELEEFWDLGARLKSWSEQKASFNKTEKPAEKYLIPPDRT